jgi:hypothetical protein
MNENVLLSHIISYHIKQHTIDGIIYLTAEEILIGEKEGTFLFRFSSKSGFLAVSYVNNKEGRDFRIILL